MNRKFLVHRTVAPRLSELFSESFELLKNVNPRAKNFAVLIRDEGDEITTRILPLTERAIAELFNISDDKVSYIAHTDEDSEFIKGEEK